VLITPSGVDYDALIPDQLATVSMAGDILDRTVAPSSEVPLHLAIYRHTSATAVVHTHSPYATAVGLVVDELPSVHYAIRALGGPVRVAPYATFGSSALARHVSEALADRRGALMRNHGAVTIGESLDEARTNAEKLEWLATLYFRAAQLGVPLTLNREQLDDVDRRARRTGYRP
jgi:L-fuculose-phosphate aldolase